MRHCSFAVALLALSCTKTEPGTPAKPTAAAPEGGVAKEAPAQPFAKDDEEAVRGALAEAGRTAGGDACFAWPASFPRVVLVGGFANDRGCELEGMFVDRTYHADGGTPTALATREFASARMEEKEAIARAWVEEALQAFGGRFVQAPTKAFELDGSPKHEPVRARLNKIGGVVVEGWVQRPSGMQDESGFDFVVYRFAPDGAVQTASMRNFTVDGERLREAERGKPGG